MTPSPKRNNSGDELNSEEYAKKLTKHDEVLEELKKRVNVLEERLGSNEKIADTLCETAEKAVKMKEMVSKVFLSSLENDVKIRENITSLVNKADRNYFFSTLKRIGGIVYTIVILAIGALITAAIKAWF